MNVAPGPCVSRLCTCSWEKEIQVWLLFGRGPQPVNVRIKLTSLEVRCGVRCGVCCCQFQCFYMIPRYFHPLLLPTMTFHVCDAQVSELATFDPRFLVATMRTLYLTNIQRSCVVSNTELRSSKADHLLPPTWQLELIADAVAKVPSHFVQR